MSNIPKIETALLIAELKQIHNRVKDLEERDILESSSAELQEIFQRLDELTALNMDKASTEMILKSPEFDSLTTSISNFRFLYNLKLEIEEAKSLIESPNPWETLQNFTFYSNYLQLARTEYTGSGLKPKDCVLFLGSGPLPLSLIVLCHEYDLQGIGIEQERERACISRKVIDHLGLSKRIQIIEGNHFSLPLESVCELYMVAAQAEPKREVFEQIAKVLSVEVKSPIASMKRVFEEFWTVVLYSSCLPDLKNI